jgi:hypothetical protein
MTGFSKWKTIGYAAAIFVAGGISGGALGVYEERSHLNVPPREQETALRLRNHLQSRLDLSPDQVAKIDPIIDSAASGIRSIRVDSAQRINKVLDDSYAQISAVLTPDQRVKLDQMQKERHDLIERHWSDSHRHPGPGEPRHDGSDNDDSPGPPGP